LANALNRLPAVQFTGPAGNQVAKLTNVGTFALTDGTKSTATIQFGATALQVKTALTNALITVTNVTGDATNGYTITGAALLSSDASKLSSDILSFDTSTGILNFKLDITGSAQVSLPFNLSLADIASFLPGPLAGIADALVGLSASGNLAATVS